MQTPRRWRRLVAAVLAAGLVVAAARWSWTAADDAGWFDANAVPVTDDVARAMLRDVKRWDAATSGERRGVAERVQKRLDAEQAGFTPLRVRPFGFEGHRHEIAVFRHETTGLEFSLIPGGTFARGSPEGETDRDADETQHAVTITEPFLLCRTETTQAAWERVMATNPSTGTAGAEHPVENVSWEDAQEFCKKAELSLPSESQWEYACRAGTTTRFWSGDSEADLAQVGWYDGNTDAAKRLPWSAFVKLGAKAPAQSHERVAARPANPYGLHDVHGNVWEWCADGWHASYAGAPTDGSAWVDSAAARVVRGGGWVNPAGFLRCASRNFAVPGVRGPGIGFRPARSVPEE